MRPAARIAMALWFLLGIVVFNVRFDWQVRMAGHAFVRQQVVRHQQGQPTLTINDHFRPLVRTAAVDGGRWFLVIASAGAVSIFGASRVQQDHG